MSQSLHDAIQEEKYRRDAVYGNDKNALTPMLAGGFSGAAAGNLSRNLLHNPKTNTTRAMIGTGALIGTGIGNLINNHKAHKAEIARRWIAEKRLEENSLEKKSTDYSQVENYAQSQIPNTNHVTAGQMATNSLVAGGLGAGLGAAFGAKGFKGKTALLGGLAGIGESVGSDILANKAGTGKTDAGNAIRTGVTVGAASALTPLLERHMYNKDKAFREASMSNKTSRIASMVIPDTAEAKEVSENLKAGKHHFHGVGKSMLNRGLIAGAMTGGMTYGLSKLLGGNDKDKQ